MCEPVGQVTPSNCLSQCDVVVVNLNIV